MSKQWPLWEVFIRGQHGLNHRHVGSIHAPDAEMAIKHARDVYTRRNEGVSIWVVKSNDVVLFMKGTPQFPMCGFSSQVVQILDYMGVEYKGVNVLDNEEVRQGIKDYANWPTIPQLYVKGEFLGGCDIVKEMFQDGELATHLTQAGVKTAQPSQS